MTEFTIGDIVKYRIASKTGCGRVLHITPKKLQIYDFEANVTITVAKDCAEILPKILLGAEMYARFARYEITVQDIVKDNVWQNIVNADNYRITLEDLLCVLEKIVLHNTDEDTFFDEWFCCISEEIENYSSDETPESFYGREYIFKKVFSELECWMYFAMSPDLHVLIDEIKMFLEDENKPLTERRFSDDEKISFVQFFDNDSHLNDANEDEVTLFVRFARELCEKENPVGLTVVGYGCYGGNRAFACDWKKSEECVLKLFELSEDEQDRSFFANTLGYIYYYGRTTNGVPDYEKAYKYFSFAAFNGVYEAQYKIADMYRNGYGVIKSRRTAENIVSRLYYENSEYIQKGIFDSKFADVAFRLGNLYKDDKNYYESDFEKMLDLYYQARFAIRMRMNETNYYGDEKVAAAIDDALAQTKKAIDFKPVKKTIWYSLYSLFYDYLNNGGMLDIKVKEMANSKYKLVFKVHNRRNDEKVKRLFITIPELDMCGLYDTVTITAVCDSDTSFVFCTEETVTVDSMEDDSFSFDGVPCVFLQDCYFEIRKPKNDEKLHRFVSVQFNPGGYLYDYLCDDENIKVGDKVKITALGEEKEVTVVKIFEKTESETSLPFKAYKKL